MTDAPDPAAAAFEEAVMAAPMESRWGMRDPRYERGWIAAYVTCASRIAELEGHVRMLIAVCDNANRGAFENGVTDSTGTIDEGEVRSHEAIHEARQALTKGRADV